MRDPVVILSECADLVPGTLAAVVLSGEAEIAVGGAHLASLRSRLRDRATRTNVYSPDEIEALTLAYEELAK